MLHENFSTQARTFVLLNNNLTSGLGGNKLIYNESEDAYYIQHGADAVRKKLGSITNATLVASNTTTQSSTSVKTSYIAAENNECLVCLCGTSGVITASGGLILAEQNKITAGGSHNMSLKILLLNKGQSVDLNGWNNVLVYKLC